MRVAYLLHHSASILVAALAFHPFLHHHGKFFIAIPELSNFFMNPVCILRTDLPYLGKRHPTLLFYVSLAFAASFIICRNIWFPIESIKWWFVMIDLLQHGHPHSTFAIGAYMVANLFFNVLFVAWGKKIFLIGYKLISGKNTNKGDKPLE
jgi:hypothetical protein